MRDVGQRDISLDERELMVSGGVEPLIERAFALTGSPVAPMSEGVYYSVDSLEDVHLVEAAIAVDPSWGKY